MTDHTATATFPACGLFRTTVAMPGREEAVAAERLVQFHNHSAQGQPIVLLPSVNTHNAWSFHDRGYLVQEAGWVSTLEALLPEGFYVLNQHMHAGDQVLPENALVQLGYNRQGDPIIFPARRVDNSLEFPERGLRFHTRGILQQLRPAGFVVVEPPKASDAEPRLLH